MKRLLFVACIAIVVMFPVGVFASRVIELPWTNNIRNVSGMDHRNHPTVSVFDDKDNKCYIVRGDANVAISCVRQR